MTTNRSAGRRHVQTNGISIWLTRAAVGGLACLLGASTDRASATPGAPPLPDKWQYTVEAADPIGTFDTPEAVATAADGSVYLSDGHNHRIQRFAADGRFLTVWGSLGDAEGQLGHPAGIAAAPDGTVVVADSLNHRLQRFTADGQFVAAWGQPAPSKGSDRANDAELDTPWAVAVAPDGTVYATDRARHRVLHYGADGGFIHAWGKEGAGNGQFKAPQGIAVSPDGKMVVVADTGNNRFQRFTDAGEFIDLWYAAGPGVQTYTKPQGVAFGGKGDLFVLDTGGDRVQRFSADGQTFSEWGLTGDEDGQFDTPVGIAAAPDGTVLVTDAGYDEVQRFTAAGAYVDSWGGYGGGDRRKPVAVAVDASGVGVWVADQGLNEITQFVEAAAPGAWTSGQRLGGYGTAPGRFRSVADVLVVDAPGPPLGGRTIFTADAANHRVDVFDALGNHLRSFGHYGHGAGEFYGPTALALADNTVWVADSKNHRLQQFTLEGVFLKSVGTLGNGEGQFKRPRGMAVDRDGSLWVADSENGRIAHLDANGGWLGSWGRKGFEAGDLFLPYDVALDDQGNVWVADSGNHRLQRFRPDGRWQAVYGGPGFEPGQFERPTGIAIVGRADIWVADSGNHRIQRLAFDGSGVKAIVTYPEGRLAGRQSLANFNRPTGLAFAAQGGRFLVADSENGRVQTFDARSGQPLNAWGSASLSPTDNGLREPEGIASLDGDNEAVVADTHNHRLQVRSLRGDLQRTVGRKGSAAGEFVRPWDLVTAPDGTVLVSDNGNGRIMRFDAPRDSSWEFRSDFGGFGRGEGQLNGPRGLAAAADGSVVVADTGNYRIARFTADGKTLPGWPIPPNGVVDPDARVQPPGPSDVAVDADGLIDVADPGFGRVRRFDRAGTALGQIGGPGAGVNRFQSPNSLAWALGSDDALHGLLAVSDSSLNRIQVFAAHYPTLWRAAYYPNRHFVGAPSTVLMTTSVAADPRARQQVLEAADYLAEDGWSVRFERLMPFGGGPERYRVRYNNGTVRVWFGDRLAVESSNAGDLERDGAIEVPAGDAVVRLEFVGRLELARPVSTSAFAFDWTPTSRPPAVYLPLVRR